MSDSPDDLELLVCPDCGVGNLRVIQWKANNSPGAYQMGQLGAYAPGGIRPTVVAECTAGCGFQGEGPGTADQMGSILAVRKA